MGQALINIYDAENEEPIVQEALFSNCTEIISFQNLYYHNVSIEKIKVKIEMNMHQHKIFRKSM